MQSVARMSVSSKAVEVAGEAFERTSELPRIFLEVVAIIEGLDAGGKYRML